MKTITIKGAKHHNLKNFNLSIPKNKFVTITGVSGSGKSSLAFDILFEEGKKQYLQSLGYIPDHPEGDKFDLLSGIAPTIAVKSNIIRQSNPRSTVGSKTGLLGQLAALFSVEGHQVCVMCGGNTDDRHVCSSCGYTNERYPVSYFIHTSPNGMCLKCAGRGSYYDLDLDKLLPHEEATLSEIVDTLDITSGFKNLFKRHFEAVFHDPFHSIDPDIKHDFIYGHHVSSNAQSRSNSLMRVYESKVRQIGEDPSGVYKKVACDDCHGHRIGDEAKGVTLSGMHIGHLCQMTMKELRHFLMTLSTTLKTPFGRDSCTSLIASMDAMIQYRLGHLSLYRNLPTLSGGEIQRLFLYMHLKSKMDSLIYILDEPTSGLHEEEKASLISVMKDLRDLGNTVIAVEHDHRVIEAADHVIDIGPRAGTEGGELIYSGDYMGLIACERSLTGKYLSYGSSSHRQIFKPLDLKRALTIENVCTNNLKAVSVSIPLGALVGVTGLSGSGKSSLISQTLIPQLKSAYSGSSQASSIKGAEQLSGYVLVSQEPIGRNLTSTVASYLGIWDDIRKRFASLISAEKLGFTVSDFSFNAKGACPDCSGTGQEKIWLGGDNFIYNTCKACDGTRYTSTVLEIKYHDKNIHEILQMTVSEASSFFKGHQKITRPLQLLMETGMGYIKLGQGTPSLSGGEAQRLKLAKELGRKRRDNLLYVLDEPTTGLSMYDKIKLIELLDRLVVQGNSILVIEHDMTVLSNCDWLIELGFKGDDDGGHLLATGSCEDLIKHPDSITGRYLRVGGTHEII